MFQFDNIACLPMEEEARLLTGFLAELGGLVPYTFF
jgi:hypothetical protein